MLVSVVLFVLSVQVGSSLGQELVYCHSCEYQVDDEDNSDPYACVDNPPAVDRTVYCPETYECYSRSVFTKETNVITSLSRGCLHDGYYTPGCTDSEDQLFHTCVEVCHENLCNTGVPNYPTKQ